MTRDEPSVRDVWTDFEEHVTGQLRPDDDPELWATAVGDVFRDAEYLCGDNPKRRPIGTEIGSCSHWLRPHQMRWTADGGFAYPVGYRGGRFGSWGLPEMDWSVRLFFNSREHRWTASLPDRRSNPKKLLLLRVSIPSRTALHSQAALHTIWTPGPPPRPKKKVVQFYGYRKIEGRWTLRAVSKAPSAYEVAADKNM
jgi:hypothetical protein